MAQPVVFRPRGGVVLAAVAIAICVVALVWLTITDGLAGLVLWGWPIALFAWLAYLLYIRPAVRVTDGFVEMQNIFRTHRVPWGDVADVESRYALTIRTRDGKTLRAWAAPAPGARQALTTRREEIASAPGPGDLRRPSDAAGTESGDATALVVRALERHRRAGDPELPGGTATTWALWPLGVTLLLAIAVAISLTQASAHG